MLRVPSRNQPSVVADSRLTHSGSFAPRQIGWGTALGDGWPKNGLKAAFLRELFARGMGPPLCFGVPEMTAIGQRDDQANHWQGAWNSNGGGANRPRTWHRNRGAAALQGTGHGYQPGCPLCGTGHGNQAGSTVRRQWGLQWTIGALNGTAAKQG